MSEDRRERSSSNRDYIPLQSSASSQSSNTTETSSSSEEVDSQLTQRLISELSSSQAQPSRVAENEERQSDRIGSGDFNEVNQVREVELVRIPSEISSGYLASNESSSGAVQRNRGVHGPAVSSPTPSSSPTTSIRSNSNLDLVTFMKSMIVSVSENAVNSADERYMMNFPETVNASAPIHKPLRRSQSTDSFFSKSSKATILCKDSSNLYRMTINVKNPCEFISPRDSTSLESVSTRKSMTNRPDCSLEHVDYHGDSEIVSVYQLQKENENSNDKKADANAGRSDHRNFLRNLNALYPTNVKEVKYDVYVNDDETKPVEKQNKVSPTKSTIFNTFLESTGIDKDRIPRAVSVDGGEEKYFQRELDMSEIFSFLSKSTRSFGDLALIKRHFQEKDPLGLTYSKALALASANLTGKLDEYNNPFASVPDRKVNEPSSLPGMNDDNASNTKESVERNKKLSVNLNSKSQSSLNDTKEISELFYLGDSKSDDGENRSDRCISSETFDSISADSKGSSQSSKWNASNPDGNNNYILSQTSSEDSMEYDDDRKFQFTKDISGKEEYLRQTPTLSEEQLAYHNECRRRVSFNNDYPVYVPARQSYLRNRKLDLTPTKSPRSTVDVASATEFFDESQEELKRFSEEYVMQQKIIDEAEKSSYKLLRDLQCLWMNVSDMGCLPTIATQTILGEHNLIQQIQLCIFIADQMNQNQDWRTSTDFSGIEKLQELQIANKSLKEQLDSCRIIQNCLESEINYAAKEKALLNDEVKHLSYQLATRTCKLEKSLPASPILTPRNTDGNTSNVASHNLEKITEENSFPNENEVCKPNFVKKREEDFNSILDCFRHRKGDMDTLNLQLDKYQDDVKALKKQIEQTNEDKEKLYRSYEASMEEKKALIRERNHYECVLKLILNEKHNQEYNPQDLLARLLTKLNTFPPDNEGKSSRFCLLEGAVQAVQEQNASYREEITQLKEKISNDTEQHILIKSELESNFQKVSQKVEELKLTIEDKNDLQKSQEKRLSKLHELEDIASQAKNALDKSLDVKDAEIAHLKQGIDEIYKSNMKQQRKIHELQKLNSKLTRETQGHKSNIEQLGAIINQLRQSLVDQKAQYSERVNAVGDEMLLSKEHCGWLQKQIDHMNNQLEDAHSRIKAHERDKSSLAQQVLSAEEERKVVDRNLNELKAALESDLVLRQALIERNEVLQIEINRLRRAKITNGLSPLMSSMPSQEGEFRNPPSEFSTISEGLSSLNSFPLSDYKPLPAGERRKNRHNPYRKGVDPPRIAVSLHNATGASASQNHGNSSLDINAAGAACSIPNEYE